MSFSRLARAPRREGYVLDMSIPVERALANWIDSMDSYDANWMQATRERYEALRDGRAGDARSAVVYTPFMSGESGAAKEVIDTALPPPTATEEPLVRKHFIGHLGPNKAPAAVVLLEKRSVGDRMREAMTDAGWAAPGLSTELAKHLGIPQPLWSNNLMSHRRTPRVPRLLAAFLGIHLEWVLTGRGEKWAGPMRTPGTEDLAAARPPGVRRGTHRMSAATAGKVQPSKRKGVPR